MRHWNTLPPNPAGVEPSPIFTLPMRHWNFPSSLLLNLFDVIFTLPMRHWNSFNWTRYRLGNKFLLYLWGIETSKSHRKYTLYTKHFYSTYEALKRSRRCNRSINKFKFLLYLWGIETTRGDGSRGEDKTIFTLPMRHWNIKFVSQFVVFVATFLLYLWGIETFYLHPLRLLSIPIFTLPMRHWNICFSCQ